MFDVFLSYNWDIKSQVTNFYKHLTESQKLKVWMDDFQMGPNRLVDGIIKQIFSLSIKNIL